MVANNMNRID